MGVKGLYTHLRNYRVPLYPDSIGASPPLRIGVDAMSLLYKFKSNYKDIYPILKHFKDAGHKPLMVFDGKPPVEKEAEVKERRDARTEAATQATTLRNFLSSPTAAHELDAKERAVLEYSIARLEHQGWHMTREIRHEVQGVLATMGIPYVKAKAEADDVLTDMACAGKLDVVISTDMDFLLCGVPRMWIPSRGPFDSYEEVVLAEVLKGEDMTLAQFRDAGILCGVEPLRGRLPAVPPQKAFAWIRHYGSLEAAVAKRPEELGGLQPEDIERARKHFTAQEPWSSRIRADHLERAAESLNAL